MKTQDLLSLCSKTPLILKPDRAAAYGEENRRVLFVRIQTKDGYKTPWIVGENDKGEVGHYRPSDFAGLEAL